MFDFAQDPLKLNVTDAQAMRFIVVVLIFITLMLIVWGVLSLVERRRQAARPKQEQLPLESKLDELRALSARLTEVNAEVRADFDLQLASAKKAQEDAANAKAILDLSREQIRATEALVEARVTNALKKSSFSERRFQIGVALSFFFLGILATVGVAWLYR